MAEQRDTRPLGVLPDLPLTAALWDSLRTLENYDLSVVRSRLLKEGAVEAALIDEAIFEFRRFLGLVLVSDSPVMMFSAAVDEVWHTSVLFTRLYADLCEQAFGYFVHHDPELTPEPDSGMPPGPDADASWRDFAAAYRGLYGEAPGNIWRTWVSEQDIEALEVRLEQFVHTLSEAEQQAFARLVARAALGHAVTQSDEARQALPS